jgi:UDP-N-acetylglucosamine--N-acetylmuramyl-(pentapeptide) pyrophosphoryl-undecaprenol N-acetylglucosamine transferase
MTNGSGPRVVLAGGGTGGHVIPAIAVAEEIVLRGGEASFVGTAERIEAKLVPKAGFALDFVDVKPLAAGGPLPVARGLASVPPSLVRSVLLLRRRRPDVVLGVGGYVAGPVVLAARILGIPGAVLEQNALVGITNRLLARFVSRAFVTYEETLAAFPSGVAAVTGNPVRASILEASRARAKKRKRTRKQRRVLVMGGSQGALAIDERVPAAMADAALGGKVRVCHQCGNGNGGAVRAAYASAGISAEVVRFIDDTAARYIAADLVVARAGATTLSELTVMGLPAVLLPYPHHKDRQQHLNAAPMARAGAALVLDEKRTTVADMADAIKTLVSDDARREASARSSLDLGRPRATCEVVDALFDMAGGG